MKTPRDLYGRDFADWCMRHWSYEEDHQTGIHIILISTPPLKGGLSVPAHKPLRVGTLNSLLRNITEQRGVSREHLLRKL